MFLIKRIIAVFLLFTVLFGFSVSVISLSRINISSNKSEATVLYDIRDIINDKISYIKQSTSDNTQYTFSEEEFELLARVISAEARGEPYIGQVAVGAVILNRVEHPSFPDTLTGVIYQKGAFSCVDDGQIDKDVTESAYNAAKEALSGKDPSGDAIYFYNPKTATNKWIYSRPIVIQIGAHIFCK